MPTRSRLSAYQDAAALHRDMARQVAALIADTITTVLPDAAYLVMGWSYSVRWLTLVLDADGTVLHDFGRRPAEPIPLPALPAGHRLLAEWGTTDPTDPVQLQQVLMVLLDGGMVLDELPETEHLSAYDPAPGQPANPACLLLSPAARPDRLSDHPGEMNTLLRPYPPADRPAPAAQSPLSDLLVWLDPAEIRLGLCGGAELLNAYGDRNHVTCPEQADVLTAVVGRFPDAAARECPARDTPGHL